ncbi:hypothetical protein T459_28026 [Capsicum annuum]|uniref:Uncharacterized protein n=1 Tax=Capsicum annuum TaxID=4072 RepID=A0A2G2YFQ1_CAPAN|nr:hypothetical protein T459_28026 [Capsicum annuum]
MRGAMQIRYEEVITGKMQDAMQIRYHWKEARLTICGTADFDLTGQLVWPGAVLLNDYLTKNANMLQGCSCIELGSGVGWVEQLNFAAGMCCSSHSNIFISFQILKENIKLQESSDDSMCCTELKAEKLEWGNSDQLNCILQGHPEGFDLVLGADIYIQVDLSPTALIGSLFLHL